MPKKDYRSILDNMEIVERVDLELRNLYTKYGYSRFKMGKFEEYDLYSGTRDFIPTEDIITVTGQKGKLLALRPDLTLSIVKYFRPEEKSREKLFYSENIYRAKKDGTYSELRQTGLELLGDLNEEEVSRVVLLAALSLKTICNDFVLDISHMGLLQEIVSSVPQEGKEDVLLAISQKNTSAIEKLGQEYSISLEEINTIKAIATLYGNYKDALPRLKKMPLTTKGKEYLLEIEKVCKFLAA
ncbi:MAG: ATP phosphoribosyltransferase regulatory subunit, partial [Firmicutes bacterium]|nr:ATP phosphoribosyltransferase regulatory subunit [Bacillota bacterium]